MSSTILTRTAAAGIVLGLLLGATACGSDQGSDVTTGRVGSAHRIAPSSGAHPPISADAAERSAQPPAISADAAERAGRHDQALHLRRQ
jgi:hypothetical protein